MGAIGTQRKRDKAGHFLPSTSSTSVSTSSTSKVKGNAKVKISKPAPAKISTYKITRKPRIHIYMDHRAEWRWDLVASNGNIIADSGEGYNTRWGCRRAARKFLGI